MEIDLLRNEVDPRTFRPFEIVLVNGATFPVNYPDSLMLPPVNRKTGRPFRWVSLYEDNSTWRTIDTTMIAQIVRHENGANGKMSA